MNICLRCGLAEDVEDKEIDYVVCDACRDENEGDLDGATIVEKARLVYENGMKWDDVLSFFDLVMLEQEDCIEIFKKFGVKEEKVVEWYESWEGSNDGA